jgi:hypothetical protein
VVNIENDYRIVRAEDRLRELGFPQNPKPVRPQPEPS